MKIRKYRVSIQLISLIILSVFSMSCKGAFQSIQNVENEIYGVSVTYIDSLSASLLINYNDKDGFFNNIMPLDISIQMQSESIVNDKALSVKNYRTYLSQQVSSWSGNEIAFMDPLLNEAISISRKLAGRFMPSEIKLVKIKTGHYGDNVYYTRGNCIMIPENIFNDFKPEVQLPILIHEIFHLISRNSPDLRDSLYKLIGFERLIKKVVLPDHLENNVLTNPDGAFRHHAIRLEKENGEKVWAIPLITSKFSKFKRDIPTFFEYINFDLYELEDLMNDSYRVKTSTKGQTTLDLGYTPSFFMKIRDNTQYIIHPEEIIADNFMLTALAIHKKEFDKFSLNGRRLVDAMNEMFRKMN